MKREFRAVGLLDKILPGRRQPVPYGLLVLLLLIGVLIKLARLLWW